MVILFLLDFLNDLIYIDIVDGYVVVYSIILILEIDIFVVIN